MSGAARAPHAQPGALAVRIAGLSGWRRWALAFGLGAAAAAAQPPVHAVPVLLISFTGLAWLLDGVECRRRAFLVGWLFGAGYFAAGLYWVSNALLVDAARFGWMIPFALGGLSFGLGLFTGVATLLARLIWSPTPARIAALAAAWTLLEWVRGVVLTGFPWNPVGNVWVAFDPVLQGAAWAGVYGLSAVTVLAAAAPAALAAPRRSLVATFAAVLPLVAVGAAGAIRLSDAPEEAVPGVVLRLVQPNISQRDKWRGDRRARNFADHLDLSRQPPAAGAPAPTHVIWPETAAPFSVTTDAGRRALMRDAVPPGGALITGSLRYRVENGRLVQLWNSLVAVDDAASVIAVYDKHHLVPFGEYVPFRDILPLERIAPGALDFSTGPGPVAVKLPGLPPFSPLICYEAIFSGAVMPPGPRPGFLLNVTNDGWFGLSAGPHQHFASARLRAVEEGVPMVRSANTGISAVVDGYGRVVARLSLGARGVVDSELPKPVIAPTLFSRLGNVTAAIIVLICSLVGVFAIRFRPLHKKETI